MSFLSKSGDTNRFLFTWWGPELLPRGGGCPSLTVPEWRGHCTCIECLLYTVTFLQIDLAGVTYRLTGEPCHAARVDRPLVPVLRSEGGRVGGVRRAGGRRPGKQSGQVLPGLGSQSVAAWGTLGSLTGRWPVRTAVQSDEEMVDLWLAA